MEKIIFLFVAYTVLSFVVFLLYWRKKFYSSQAPEIKNLEEFYKIANKPILLFHTLHGLGYMVVATALPVSNLNKLEGLLIAFVLSFLISGTLTNILVFPWRKKLAGEDLKRFIKYTTTTLRFTIAMASPYLIYLIFNDILFDSLLERSDAYEILILNIGRITILSLLTIVLSVILMMKLIPNSKIEEDEYLDLIHRRIHQSNLPIFRLRWIDIPDFHNAFVAGFKWFGFSNQTMFIGKGLKDLLTKEEFDAVICHELGHIAHKHMLKRITYSIFFFIGTLLTVFLSLILGAIVTLIFSDNPVRSVVVFGFFFTTSILLSLIGSYSLLFKSYREQEHQADEFAVMNMGIKIENLESSLRKLTQKGTQQKRKIKIDFLNTHPQVEQRVDKVRRQLDGTEENWTPSFMSRFYDVMVKFLSPKTLAATFACCIVLSLFVYQNLQQVHHYHKLIASGDLSKIELFNGHSHYVNSKQFIILGSTPLERAANAGKLEVVQFLIRNGANPEKGNAIMVPVDLAIRHQHWEVVSYLLDKLSDDYLKQATQGYFHTALRRDDEFLLEILLQKRLQRFLSDKEKMALYERALGQTVVGHKVLMEKAGFKTVERLPASTKN